MLGVGWLTAPYIGAATGSLSTRIDRSAMRDSHPSLIGWLAEVVGLVGLVLVPVGVGIVVTILASRLGLP